MTREGDDMEDNPEAHAILETLAGRYNELQANAKADETFTIKVSGVAIERLTVRGSMLWFYGKDDGIVFAQHYTQANVVLMKKRLAEGEKPTPIGFLTEPTRR
jgi:uncharacterized membrane protein (UPF0136 family)